jgi:subtilisin-like proprotein convertase family protein
MSSYLLRKLVRASKTVRKTSLDVELLECREVMAGTVWSVGSGAVDLAETFALHSNPTAKQIVYLDFDGHSSGDVYGSSWDNIVSPAWDGGGNGPSFTSSEMTTIQRVWARVAEDFAPFNIDVTTQDPGVEGLRKTSATDDRWGIRVVITPNDQPAPGAGGVAYIGSFNFSTDTPAYVFNSSEKSIAEAATHEAGHSLGLNHDGTATLGYYSGHGTGVTSWGPIMGASYSPNVTQWSRGEYSGANNREDDLAIITAQNGFTYRSDDVGSAQATATSLLPQGSTQVTPFYGIIEKNTDADYFSFWSGAGPVTLNVNTAPIGPNLAVRADLYNASGTLLGTFNPANSLDAVVSYTVATPGQYFVKIAGAGRGDPLTNGFSNYASLGNYRITGAVTAYVGGGVSNAPPVAVADAATTVAGVPVTLNVLANDSDPNGDPLTITGLSNIANGTAVISGGAVVFTPAAGFTGSGTFTYTISDGKGGTASAQGTVTVSPGSSAQTFTNNTDVAISSVGASTVTSSITIAGLAGSLLDVDVKVNIYHTWVGDLQITLIAPDGTRIQLFNRYGGSADNILGATFDDSAATSISRAAAPFTGTFRPAQLLSALNGKSPNGIWKLEIRDRADGDGGRIDNWSLVIKTSAAPSARSAGTIDLGGANALWNSVADIFADTSIDRLFDVNSFQNRRNRSLANFRSIASSLNDAQLRSVFEEWFGAVRDADLPAFRR